MSCFGVVLDRAQVVLMYGYLELRDHGKWGDRPIWPVVFDPHAGDELFKMYDASDIEKKKYAGQLRLLAASRSVIVEMYMATPLLAPVHDVMRCDVVRCGTVCVLCVRVCASVCLCT